MNPENNQEIKKIQFSWRRIGKVVGAVVVAALVLLGIWLIVISRPVKIAWADWILNKRENYLSCYDLPFFPKVEKTLGEHQDAVKQLSGLGAGAVTAEQIRCKAWDGGLEFVKGDVLINYHSRGQKDAIEKFLGPTFFGMAYRGQPVK